MNKNTIKPLANAICIEVMECSVDNTLTTQNTKIFYGSYIVNDEPSMYIKIVELDGYGRLQKEGETLMDVTIPWTAYTKCRWEIQTLLEEVLEGVE